MMSPSELTDKLAKKDYNLPGFIEIALRDSGFRDLLVEQILSNKEIMVYYHCYEILSGASYLSPGLFYVYWDDMRKLLYHPNSYHRDIGLTILANLTKADEKNLVFEVFDEYLSHLRDKKFMTACCCIANLKKIVQNKPQTTDAIVMELLSLERICGYPDKQKALLMGYIIEVFDSVYDTCGKKPEILTYVHQHAKSISPKTRKIAKMFLSHHNL